MWNRNRNPFILLYLFIFSLFFSFCAYSSIGYSVEQTGVSHDYVHRSTRSVAELLTTQDETEVQLFKPFQVEFTKWFLFMFFPLISQFRCIKIQPTQ